ncbi:circularly permuted type 2 ATP-grasp protein [Labrys wisconsinensis]|uniref:Circularly permuted ATP-grasp superfamily protein/putative alpha-E superfamily protein n=1 Tax=Labrys wisconsinensis TaxID=425677 RepID=A0ABU0J1M5_9HYPH|nr:circularly permuted type 2 ATP-grasp protein [Labrys wisconsinensis]MDQ0467353.1 putative circularly permuted ATP-grasp superfamily protein/putative alpha-E superfamily protein [Labrys wisconsinensis]
MLVQPKSAGWSRILAGYAPPAGGADELVDGRGRVRSHWAPVLAELAAGGAAGMRQRFALADRHLKDSGVYYRVYDADGGGERPWPLSHLPLVIPAAEWRGIEAGVIQRAQILEMILADLYGPARLVREGALPAAVVAGNPDFLRPLAGVTQRGGEELLVYAVDLGRAPDGRWWVLGDRCQAPSGMGYAVENRLAISAALPALYRDMHVERLAGFFQALRSGLAAKFGREGSRIGLLTPGPANETYFEHAYLARYLGFLLVEGGDLTVQDNVVYVRTIEGLKRIDVLLRRLDADFADPLELTASSRIGVPGLVQAVRAGSVTLANSLGAGLLEARAMLAFIPALARRLTGEELKLPNVATWWCGDPSVRAEVLDRLDQRALAPAFSRPVPGLTRDGPTLAAERDEAGRAGLAAAIESHALDVVAQDVIRLATMPVWTGERLEPRPFTLRVFAVATPEGWRVMHGGFCRVAEGSDARALSMQRGGRSADVWIASEGPVEKVTLLPQPDRVAIRRRLGHLPSRAADNLFWLGRYLERAEGTLRVVRALAELSVEAPDETGEAPARLANLLISWGAAAADDQGADTPKKVRATLGNSLVVDIDEMIRQAFEGDGNGAIPVLVRAAGRTASVIRERLSPDATRALADLGHIIEEERDLSPVDRADKALRVLAALSGLAQENMNRISGWRFMQIGKRIERGILTCRQARRLAGEGASEGALDALLKVTDSRITYRARYLMGTLRLPVLDLVLLDDGNPRSVAFQLGRLADHLAHLPGVAAEGEIDAPGKTIRLLRATVEVSEAQEIDEAMILSIENRLLTLSNEVTARYFGQGEVPVETTEGLG